LISAAVLNSAYRNARDADVRERILLITRVRLDKKEASSVAEKEFHRSRWWAYKWLKRFDNAGLRGLENRHRSGRPPEVSDEYYQKILGQVRCDVFIPTSSGCRRYYQPCQKSLHGMNLRFQSIHQRLYSLAFDLCLFVH
jgi:hypothetical protein